MNPQSLNSSLDLPWFEPSRELLAARFTAQSFPHALLVLAPEGCGKRIFAETIVASLICQQPPAFAKSCGQCKSCLLMKAGSYPDCYQLDRLVDSKGKQKNSIGVDQVRELIEKLQGSAQMGGWRCALIGSVDCMTRAAFNALLKTLEEPGANTLLILLANAAHNVPATIRSRCQLVEPRLCSQITRDWLSARVSAPAESIDFALEQCFFAPLQAENFLDQQGEQKIKQLYALCDQLLQNRITPQTLLAQSEIPPAELCHALAGYFCQLQKKLATSTLHQPAIYALLPASQVFQFYLKLVDYNQALQSGGNLSGDLQILAILVEWYELGRMLRLSGKLT